VRLYRSYHHFFVTRGFWVLVIGLVQFGTSVVMPHGSVASEVCISLFAFSIAVVCVLFGLDVSLIGLCLFYKRYQKSMAMAVIGLLLCLICGAFFVFSAVTGCIMTLR